MDEHTGVDPGKLNERNHWESNDNSAIRSNFVPEETHGGTRGARLVCPLGCAAFGDNTVSGNYVTKENWSLHVATLSIIQL